jgi:hypothetical protein
LIAYQAELLKEVGKQLDPYAWDEICIVTDLNRCSSRNAIQGLAVVEERALLISLSSLTDKEKMDLLDPPL